MTDRFPATIVERLTVSQFRSHETLRLDVGAGPVVLTGPNGAGKTNLLEALSFLAPGRGLRGASLREVARWGGPSGSGGGAEAGHTWAVAARLRIGARDVVDIGTGFEMPTGGGRERRLVRIDGQPAPGHGSLGALFPVLWLTPEMDPLFRGPAQERRRFFDRLVAALDPDHIGRSSAYARAQRDRLKLLRGDRPNSRWLDALEDVMARYGVAVVAARRDLMDRLRLAVEDAHGSFPGVRLAMASEVDGWLAAGPALAAEDRLRERLAAERAEDARRDATASGAHRDDILAFHARTGAPAGQASTGEQKAMLIALVLAQSRVIAAARGIAPLLLLDDVAAHLDPHRRDALSDALADLGVQAWVSGTDAHAFESWRARAQFFRLDSGGMIL